MESEVLTNIKKILKHLGLWDIKAFTLNKGLTKEIFDISLECEVITYGNKSLNIEVFVASDTPNNILTFDHFCLQVEDREGLLRRCEAGGLTVRCVPRGNSVAIFVKDFDGNQIEIKGP
ncbi:MAG: hypothetical protein ISS63_04630 [Desulfobacteraceae bacterium]|nr:hypothetical protein [Desulfobacteraceae bacterium]